MAPLTGIAFTINWLIGKLNLKIGVIKTTRMTSYFFLFFYFCTQVECYDLWLLRQQKRPSFAFVV
ncbi:hypothetical protein OA43_06125 [Klebsiella variicola]|nr:hypothetical protein OA43_06125 [Klebsiella variicola]